jgi:hypothetical protein
LPLRATAISGVSPSGFFVLGSAPALSRASMIGAEPMIAASVIAGGAELVLRFGVGARLDQRAHQLEIVVGRRIHDRRRAIGTRGVDVDALAGQEPHHRRAIAAFSGVEERVLRGVGDRRKPHCYSCYQHPSHAKRTTEAPSHGDRFFHKRNSVPQCLRGS